MKAVLIMEEPTTHSTLENVGITGKLLYENQDGNSKKKNSKNNNNNIDIIIPKGFKKRFVKENINDYKLYNFALDNQHLWNTQQTNAKKQNQNHTKQGPQNIPAKESACPPPSAGPAPPTTDGVRPGSP